VSPTTRLFSSEDATRITEAVHSAEASISGEIVPYVVDRSDTYEDTLWRGGMLFGILALLGFLVAEKYSGLWISFDVATITLGTLVAMVGGMVLVVTIPPLKRILAGRAVMDRRVAQRAAEAFLSEEVFKTRERTGILIFVSMFEHEVLVVGDSGINAKVDSAEWNEIVDHILAGVKSGRAADGLIEGIHMCATLLKQKGFTTVRDNPDELQNTLRRGASPQP
jgi:putative membrane protein